MDLQEFKAYNIKEKLNIDDKKFGRIFIFIDFANVNFWFAEDIIDWDNNRLNKDEKLSIDLEKLHGFGKCFSEHIRIYYGHDSNNEKSEKFLGKTKAVFGKYRVFTKSIQQIKHYLNEEEKNVTTRKILTDNEGQYVLLPKCNFDVEISVDSIRLIDKYDTFCLFSSDADFISLLKHIKNSKKKVILIKAGHVQRQLRSNSDLVINAQDIKQYIAFKKQKSSSNELDFAKNIPVSTGREVK